MDTSLYRKTLGEKLRAVRGTNSLEKAAKELGVKTVTLKKIEDGKVDIRLLTLHKLCKQYGISPATLLEDLPDYHTNSC